MPNGTECAENLLDALNTLVLATDRDTTFRMATVTSGSATIYYECHGAGPAVVLAHGAAGNAASWWQQVPALARHNRVIVFDHRGFGRSRCPEDAISAVHFESDVLAILNQEGISQAALVGQSMGGWTCVRMACVHPARVRCVVLSNTSGAVLTDALIANAAPLREARNAGLAGSAISRAFAESEPEKAFLYAQIDGLNPGTSAAAAVIGIDSFVSAEQLSNYRIPTLMITSDLDIMFPRSVIEQTAPLLGATIVDIVGAGHSPYFEKPDVFNAALESFLAQHTAERPLPE